MPWTCGDLCGSKVRETGKPNRKFGRLCLERVFFLQRSWISTMDPLVVQFYESEWRRIFVWERWRDDWFQANPGLSPTFWLGTEQYVLKHSVYIKCILGYVIHRQSVSKPVGKSIHKFDQIRLWFISCSFRGLFCCLSRSMKSTFPPRLPKEFGLFFKGNRRSACGLDIRKTKMGSEVYRWGDGSLDQF